MFHQQLTVVVSLIAGAFYTDLPGQLTSIYTLIKGDSTGLSSGQIDHPAVSVNLEDVGQENFGNFL